MPTTKKPKQLEVRLDDLTTSPLNPRKTFPEDSLRDLADSIASKGLLQPLVVRPIRLINGREMAGGYEVVCGERRFRASLNAGVEKIPVIVRYDLDDDGDALEAMILENNQREDVQPLEEAEAFAALANRGRSVAEIATKLGRSESYVRGRLQLCQLHPDARTVLERGYLPLGGALVLASLREETQAEVIQKLADESDWPSDLDFSCLGQFQYPMIATRRDVLSVIRAHKRGLALAPWDLDDAELVPDAGACSRCPSRTGAQADLFGDGDDDCLDATCWRAKGAALAQRRAAAGETVITGEEATKLLGYGGGLAWGSGKVNLAAPFPDHPDDDRGFRGLTWRDVLTEAGALDEVERAVVAGPEGELLEVADETAAWAAAETVAPRAAAAFGPGPKGRTSRSSSGEADTWKERERQRAAKGKLQREERRRCTEALVAAIESESGPPPCAVAELLVGITVRTVGQTVLDEVCKRRGLKADSMERANALLAALEDLDEESEVWALLVELLIGQEMQVNTWSDADPLKDGEMSALLHHYAVDVAKHRREAKAATKPKRKPKTKRASAQEGA